MNIGRLVEPYELVFRPNPMLYAYTYIGYFLSA
jgi:hypothetical protein